MTAMPGRRTDYLYPVAFTPSGPAWPQRKKPIRANRDDLPSWDGAACTGENTQLWFSDSSEDRTKALAICARCPYTGGHGACATFAREAISPKIHDGIWGGIDMGVKENRVRPVMCIGPGCDKAATGRRKYCSDRCYWRADVQRRRGRQRQSTEFSTGQVAASAGAR
jgi:hypothetical protein